MSGVSLVVQLAERDGLEIESVAEDLVALVPRCTDAPDNPDCYANAAWGGGTVEFYFQTEEPVLTFEKLRPMLERNYRNRLEAVAWWNAFAERWIVLWPLDFRGEFTPHPGDDHEEEEKLEYVEELQADDDEAAPDPTPIEPS